MRKHTPNRTGRPTQKGQGMGTGIERSRQYGPHPEFDLWFDAELERRVLSETCVRPYMIPQSVSIFRPADDSSQNRCQSAVSLSPDRRRTPELESNRDTSWCVVTVRSGPVYLEPESRRRVRGGPVQPALMSGQDIGRRRPCGL